MPGNEILVEAAFQRWFESDSKFPLSLIFVVFNHITIKCSCSGAVKKLDWVSLCFLIAMELCKISVVNQQE